MLLNCEVLKWPVPVTVVLTKTMTGSAPTGVVVHAGMVPPEIGSCPVRAKATGWAKVGGLLKES